MATAAASIPPAGLAPIVQTDFAKKYGIRLLTNYIDPTTDQPTDTQFGPGKSGLTPLVPTHPFLTKQEKAQRQYNAAYQQYTLSGFTTQLLRQLDCISDRSLDTQGLHGTLLPLFERDKWEDQPLSFYTDGRTLYTVDPLLLNPGESPNTTWTAHQPKIWNVIRPSLVLASMIINKSPELPWFDALLLGRYERIKMDRFTPGSKLSVGINKLATQYVSVHMRTVAERYDGQAAVKMRQLLTDVLEKKITFAFSSTTLDPVSETRRLNDGQIIVFLAHEMVSPLFRKDLSDGDRLLEQFNIAKILVHEIVHCFNHARLNYSGSTLIHYNDSLLWIEPYFEAEQVTELGLSFEQSIFGGMINEITGEQRFRGFNPPHMALLCAKFPDFGGKPQNHPTLTNPDISRPAFAFPISISYYEKIQTLDWWDASLRKFGITSDLRPPKPAILGLHGLQLHKGISRTDALWQPRDWEVKLESEAMMMPSWDVNWYERLFTLTAKERKEHAKAFLGDIIAGYVPLMYQRDIIAREVLDHHLLLTSTLESDPAYATTKTDLLSATKRLSTQHESIITTLADLWLHSGALSDPTIDAMNVDTLEFHIHFRNFIEGYALLETLIPGDWTQQLQIHDIIGQSIAHVPIDDTEEILNRKYQDAVDACMAIPPNIKVGKELADKLLHHIGIPLLVEAKTRMLLHNHCATLLSVRENLAHLRRAKVLFVANPGNENPNTILWIDIQVAKLEKQEAAENAGIP